MCRTHNRKKYIVGLSTEERRDLTSLTSTGKAAARRIPPARILMLADEGPCARWRMSWRLTTSRTIRTDR